MQALVSLFNALGGGWQDSASQGVAMATSPPSSMKPAADRTGFVDMIPSWHQGTAGWTALRRRALPAAAAKPFAARAEIAPSVSAPRRHGETVVAQQLLEHWDRRSWIALLALSDRDAGVETLGREASLALAKRVCFDE
jgi:hypothetical protein